MTTSNKNSPVGIYADYEKMEGLKIQALKERVQRAKAEIEAGATTGGDAFFDELLTEAGD